MAKILTIEGKQDNLIPISESLNHLIPGCVILTAQSGAEGIRKARQELPDTILLDSILEDMNGFELGRMLKDDEKTKDIPVIMLTAPTTDSKSHVKGLALGVDAFMTRPFDEGHLVAQVNAMLRIKKEVDTLRKEKGMLENAVQEKTEALRKRTHDLGERVKKLNCLYGISDLREKPGISLEEILQGVTDLIPSSMQYPEITCARILLGYQVSRTENFRETPWKKACDIIVRGEWAGNLEVYYLERPESDGEPFLPEEVSMLSAIAERLGRIAERVQAEEALRLEGENIVNILKSMEDLIYKVNDQYEIQYVNPALKKEFGQLNGRKCYEYFYNLKDVCPTCKNEEVLAGKTVRREWYSSKTQKTYDVIETPLKNPDGSISKLSIYRDVTTIKQAQKALEERELLYRRVTESIADGAVMVQEGKILFVNNALVEMFGYKGPKELAGRDVIQLFDGDFREFFRRVFDHGEHEEDNENLFRGVCVTKEGKKFWASTHRSVISLKSRPAILATIRDITEDVLWQRSIQEETEHLLRENIRLRSSIKDHYRFGNIIGKSRAMQEVYELILKAAGSDANIIILGESGTGKELVARAIHDLSVRADKAFVPVNCGAIPENLVESEFFGHSKGAFTGAHINKKGYLHTADGGTLFLDEVGELGPNIQVKLLRAFESGEYNPVGDTHIQRSNLRIISATNRDFSGMVEKGLIRDDFYYRVSVIPVSLPPLRAKKDDIPLLIERFLKLYGKGRKVPTIPGKIMEVLYNYDWPGNVRELQGVIQRYLAVGNFDFLAVEDKASRLEDEIHQDIEKEATNLQSAVGIFEKRFILNALKQNRWHRGKVAAALGIDPKTLYVKIKKIGLS